MTKTIEITAIKVAVNVYDQNKELRAEYILTLPINLYNFNKAIRQHYGDSFYITIAKVNYNFRNCNLAELNRAAKAINRFSLKNHIMIANDIIKALLALPKVNSTKSNAHKTNVAHFNHCLNHAQAIGQEWFFKYPDNSGNPLSNLVIATLD